MESYPANAGQLCPEVFGGEAIVNQKQLFKEKLSSFEQKANNRFELTEKFLKTNITNAELANEGIPEEILREFKKVGLNFQIKDRTVLFEPRGAWKILSDSEFFGGNTLGSALRADPNSASDSDFQFWRCFLIDVRTFFDENPNSEF